MIYRAVEQLIQEQMQAGHVPGLALAVVQGQEIVYARGFGLTSVEDGGLPITPKTLFRIGSITKALTTTAILSLVEAGQLDLDRPVRDYVPWLAFSQEGAAERITLRLLLSHTAGLPTSHTPYGRRDPSGLEAHVREDLPHYRFVAPPGLLYAYSNPGIRVAGYVAQAVSGRPYADLMRELVFEPLAMERTTFDPTVAMTYPLAQSHDLWPGGALRVRHRYADDSGGYPSGGAISTALDLSHFAIMLMDGGRFRGRRVLAPASVAAMQAVQADKYTVAEAGYGLALAIDTFKGLRRVGHDGSISTFGSKLVMVPQARLALVLLFNRAPGFWDRAQALVDRLLDLLLGLPAEAPLPRAAEPDRTRWPLYAGSYLGDWRGLATVQVAGDRLALHWNGAAIPLSALRPDLYFGHRPGSAEVVSVGFVTQGPAPVDYLQVNSSPCRRFQPGPVPPPAPETWRAYVGLYTGVETLAVCLRQGQLWVWNDEVDREMPCVPLGEGRFACDVGLLEFQVAADGSVPSLRFGQVYTLSRAA